MDDLISRADAINAFWEDSDIRTAEVRATLRALPSAELPAEAEFTDLPDIPRYYYEKVVGNMAHEINMLKEQLESADAEWIPVSERLPDVGRDVLFSVADMYVAEGCIRADGDWTQFRWSAIQRKEEVTAWMPLPKPYECGAKMKGGAE